jgi:hypothetical protein
MTVLVSTHCGHRRGRQWSGRVSVIGELTNGERHVFENPRATWRPEIGGALTILSEPSVPPRIRRAIAEIVPIVTFAPGS